MEDRLIRDRVGEGKKGGGGLGQVNQCCTRIDLSHESNCMNWFTLCPSNVGLRSLRVPFGSCRSKDAGVLPVEGVARVHAM